LAATNGAASACSHADRHSDAQSDRDTPAIVGNAIRPDEYLNNLSRVLIRASRWIRITDRVNAAIWRMPLSPRIQSRLSALVYRSPAIGAERVVETLDALERAEVAVCCMGGWGVDALLGEQSRVHRDLDLIVDQEDWDAAREALAALGYETWYQQRSDKPLISRFVVRDRAMRVVDIHPVDLDQADLKIVTGTIAARPVRCLSAEQQYRHHQKFRNRLPRERRSQRSNAEIARRLLETESDSSD
jgi:lincosamide nucleotidyltransferase A/C/D/E